MSVDLIARWDQFGWKDLAKVEATTCRQAIHVLNTILYSAKLLSKKVLDGDTMRE